MDAHDPVVARLEALEARCARQAQALSLLAAELHATQSRLARAVYEEATTHEGLGANCDDSACRQVRELLRGAP